jgi:hypothetical protein
MGRMAYCPHITLIIGEKRTMKLNKDLLALLAAAAPSARWVTATGRAPI